MENSFGELDQTDMAIGNGQRRGTELKSLVNPSNDKRVRSSSKYEEETAKKPNYREDRVENVQPSDGQ